MAYQIEKIDVDGVTFVGCRLTGNDQETALVGVAEATVASAGTGATLTITTVASPTTSPSPGQGRSGIDYVPRGRHERCAVCGFVWHKRQMIPQRGGWVDRDCYDQVIPIRGRTGHVPGRRWSSIGGG